MALNDDLPAVVAPGGGRAGAVGGRPGETLAGRAGARGSVGGGPLGPQQSSIPVEEEITVGSFCSLFEEQIGD